MPLIPPAAAVVEFRDVSKVYEGGDVGLEDATFSVHRGEFVFLVGSTGSGKSTLMRLLIKEHEPSAGSIRVAGRDLAEIDRKRVPYYRRNIGDGLPGLQAAAQPHRLRQRRLRAPGHRRHAAARSARRCPTSCA